MEKVKNMCNEHFIIESKDSDLSSICIESVYIIDVKEQCIQCVSGNDLLIGDHSRKDINDFCSRIYPNDLVLLKRIYNVILSSFCIVDQQENVSYFSFTVRVKDLPQTNKSDYIMTYCKLKPAFHNGNLHTAVCTLNLSVIPKSGNLRVYFKDTQDFDEYSFSNKKWKRRQNEYLNQQERKIIMLSVQGFSNKKIADKLRISSNTLHKAITKLLTKLGVQNLEHAGIYAINHLLLFRQANPDKSSFSPESPQKGKGEKNKGKKHNRKLTDEKLCRIQSCLDNKQSVNSIAKEVEIARGSIRNAIKNGKLHKNDDGNPKKIS